MEDHAIDALLRCDHCKRLVLSAVIGDSKGCPRCSNRRFSEVRQLSIWEYLRVRWLMTFPNKDKFLEQFDRG